MQFSFENLTTNKQTKLFFSFAFLPNYKRNIARTFVDGLNIDISEITAYYIMGIPYVKKKKKKKKKKTFTKQFVFFLKNTHTDIKSNLSKLCLKAPYSSKIDILLSKKGLIN